MNIPPEVSKIIEDIETIKIQGATAVAEACFNGIKLYLQGYKGGEEETIEVLMMNVEKVGLMLVHARPNEPLARNGLRFLLNTYRVRHPDGNSAEQARADLEKIMDEFLVLLSDAKKKIVEVGGNNFGEIEGVMTHCHSSTVENVCKEINQKRAEKGFVVTATETRPLFQGRITAKNLLDAGLQVNMVVDSAITSFLVGDWDVPTDVVFVGCDEITVTGDTVNKVGSYAVALSAYFASRPVYVVGTLLKLDLSTVYDRPKIEMRSAAEIWPEAPEGLRIINPAFEIIPHEFITGFITEFGVIAPEKIEKELSEHYEWLW